MISDRKKDVIITGGENVSSIEVEDVLFSHPAVAEAAVIGVPDEKWGETIKALVVVADGAEVTEAELIAHCKAKVAGYKAPTSVEFREEIPRTARARFRSSSCARSSGPRASDRSTRALRFCWSVKVAQRYVRNMPSAGKLPPRTCSGSAPSTRCSTSPYTLRKSTSALRSPLSRSVRLGSPP